MRPQSWKKLPFLLLAAPPFCSFIQAPRPFETLDAWIPVHGHPSELVQAIRSTLDPAHSLGNVDPMPAQQNVAAPEFFSNHNTHLFNPAWTFQHTPWNDGERFIYHHEPFDDHSHSSDNSRVAAFGRNDPIEIPARAPSTYINTFPARFGLSDIDAHMGQQGYVPGSPTLPELVRERGEARSTDAFQGVLHHPFDRNLAEYYGALTRSQVQPSLRDGGAELFRGPQDVEGNEAGEASSFPPLSNVVHQDLDLASDWQRKRKPLPYSTRTGTAEERSSFLAAIDKELGMAGGVEWDEDASQDLYLQADDIMGIIREWDRLGRLPTLQVGPYKVKISPSWTVGKFLVHELPASTQDSAEEAQNVFLGVLDMKPGLFKILTSSLSTEKIANERRFSTTKSQRRTTFSGQPDNKSMLLDRTLPNTLTGDGRNDPEVTRTFFTRPSSETELITPRKRARHSSPAFATADQFSVAREYIFEAIGKRGFKSDDISLDLVVPEPLDSARRTSIEKRLRDRSKSLLRRLGERKPLTVGLFTPFRLGDYIVISYKAPDTSGETWEIGAVAFRAGLPLLYVGKVTLKDQRQIAA